jgi:hypothetical protein
VVVAIRCVPVAEPEVGWFVMKMAVDLKEWWRQKREDLALQHRESTAPSFLIPSPVEEKDAQGTIDDHLRAARAKHCTDGILQSSFKS